MKHTPGPWVVDDGMVRMSDQAPMLIADEGTNRRWVAIGIEDEDGFAEVVALAHPINAHLIAAAPDLLEACKVAYLRLQTIPSFPDQRKAMELCGYAIAKAKEKG